MLWLLAPLMAGLAAAKTWPVPAFGLEPLVAVATVAGLGAAACALRPGRAEAVAWAVLIAVAAGLGGFAMLHARHPDPPAERTRPPREVTLTLRIRQPFPVAPMGRQLSGLGVVVASSDRDRELVGRLVHYSAIRRISLPPQRSGCYVMRGVIEPLPRDAAGGGFNDYLVNLGVRHRLMRAHVMTEAAPPGRFQAFCARTQDRLEAILRHGLENQPQVTSIYLAMLLGEKAVLTADQENAYMRSGTFHIFSISGLHVAGIAGALYLTGGFMRVPKKWSSVVALLILWFYVQITGASAPAMRAFLMIAFLTVYQSFRLPGNPLAALVAAALATLLVDPLQLFSTGFQMSYAVVIALVVMGQPLTHRWLASWKPFAYLPRDDWGWHHHKIADAGTWLIRAFATSWTAFLASTPSGIGYFQLFSPGALVANLVIIPLCLVVMGAGFVSLVAGLCGLLMLSALSNLVAAWTTIVMDWLLRQGTALPGTWFNASYRADWLAPWSLVFMTAVLLAGAAGRWAPRHGGYWPPVVLLALLVIFGVKFGA